MSTITLRFDTSETHKTIARYKQRFPKAVRRALNRAATSARAAMAGDMARDLGLKVGAVRDKLKIQQATDTEFVARISVTGGPIPLIDFNARGPEPSRGRGRGVTARLSGGAGRYPNAFIARMPTGHRGVFQRVPNARRRGPTPHRSQLPIYQLYGPSLPHVFAKFLPAGVARGEESLRKNLQSELRFAAAEASS